MERIVGGSSGSIPSLVPVSTSPFSRVPTSSAHPRDMPSVTSASTTPIARNENRTKVPPPDSARSKAATPTQAPPRPPPRRPRAPLPAIPPPLGEQPAQPRVQGQGSSAGGHERVPPPAADVFGQRGEHRGGRAGDLNVQRYVHGWLDRFHGPA